MSMKADIEAVYDQKLKDAGLFEDGLSFEIKQQYCQMLAESCSTAAREEQQRHEEMETSSKPVDDDKDECIEEIPSSDEIIPSSLETQGNTSVAANASTVASVSGESVAISNSSLVNNEYSENIDIEQANSQQSNEGNEKIIRTVLTERKISNWSKNSPSCIINDEHTEKEVKSSQDGEDFFDVPNCSHDTLNLEDTLPFDASDNILLRNESILANADNEPSQDQNNLVLEESDSVAEASHIQSNVEMPSGDSNRMATSNSTINKDNIQNFTSSIPSKDFILKYSKRSSDKLFKSISDNFRNLQIEEKQSRISAVLQLLTENSERLVCSKRIPDVAITWSRISSVTRRKASRAVESQPGGSSSYGLRTRRTNNTVALLDNIFEFDNEMNDVSIVNNNDGGENWLPSNKGSKNKKNSNKDTTAIRGKAAQQSKEQQAPEKKMAKENIITDDITEKDSTKLSTSLDKAILNNLSSINSNSTDNSQDDEIQMIGSVISSSSSNNVTYSTPKATKANLILDNNQSKSINKNVGYTTPMRQNIASHSIQQHLTTPTAPPAHVSPVIRHSLKKTNNQNAENTKDSQRMIKPAPLKLKTSDNEVPESSTRESSTSASRRSQSSNITTNDDNVQSFSVEDEGASGCDAQNLEIEDCVECPLCYQMFSKSKIEVHASNCDGRSEPIVTRKGAQLMGAKNKGGASDARQEHRNSAAYNSDSDDDIFLNSRKKEASSSGVKRKMDNSAHDSWAPKTPDGKRRCFQCNSCVPDGKPYTEHVHFSCPVRQQHGEGSSAVTTNSTTESLSRKSLNFSRSSRPRTVSSSTSSSDDDDASVIALSSNTNASSGRTATINYLQAMKKTENKGGEVSQKSYRGKGLKRKIDGTKSNNATTTDAKKMRRT